MQNPVQKNVRMMRKVFGHMNFTTFGTFIGFTRAKSGVAAPQFHHFWHHIMRFLKCPNWLCPQSPRAKFLRNFSKRSAKNAAKFWRNFSQIFVLQFPGKMAANNFTKNPRHFPRCTKLSFFTAATLGPSGPKNWCFGVISALSHVHLHVLF